MSAKRQDGVGGSRGRVPRVRDEGAGERIESRLNRGGASSAAGVDRERITGRTRLLGVIGHPVAHSLSPEIHNAFIRAAGIDAVYVALDVEPRELARAMAGLRALGFVGLSVTYPHKEAVIRWLDALDPVARALGAVNTIVRDRRGRTEGHNTDGAGLVRWLTQEVGMEIAGRRIVILGAGGAARSVVRALWDAGPVDLAVVNRSRRRLTGRSLAAWRRLGPRGGRRRGTRGGGAASAGGPATLRWGALDTERACVEEWIEGADLVIHATPWGLAGTDAGACPWPLWRLGAGAVVVDLNYRVDGPTPFLSMLGEGVAGHDGVGMLRHQAAVAFERWFGVRADMAAALGVVGPGRRSG